MNNDVIKNIITAIEYSFKYPFSNSESKYGSSIQGICSFILSPLIIPSLLLIGYMLEIRESAIEDTEVPKFENYNELIKEGFNGLLAYSPIISLFIISTVFGLIIPPLLVLSLFCLYIWPAASLIYTIKRDYKKVYSTEFFQMITSKFYIKTYFIFTIFILLLILLSIIFGSITLGLGFIMFVPILLYVRPAFWGYMYRNKTDELLTDI